MADRSTTCTVCGVVIQELTAERNEGLCTPCHRKLTGVDPPDAFEIPADLAAHMISKGYDPRGYRKFAWQHRFDPEYMKDYFRSDAERQSECDALRDAWWPRLRDFAEQCRHEVPLPAADILSELDRAKQQVYVALFNGARRDSDGKKVPICNLPLIAIPIAHECWPQRERAVYLTPEELSRWGEIYSHPREVEWWFVHERWSVDEFKGNVTDPQLRLDPAAVAGKCLWTVYTSSYAGGLIGSGKTDLWSSDAGGCRRLRTLMRLIS